MKVFANVPPSSPANPPPATTTVHAEVSKHVGPVSISGGEHRQSAVWLSGTLRTTALRTDTCSKIVNLNGKLQQRQREHTGRDQALAPRRRSPVLSSTAFRNILSNTGESPASSELGPCTEQRSSLPKVASEHQDTRPPLRPPSLDACSHRSVISGRGPPRCPACLVSSVGSVAFLPEILSPCLLCP